jgi:ribonuclease P protein component
VIAETTGTDRADFPRSVRVRLPGEYTRIFADGKRSAHPLLSLHWLQDSHPARLGLAVSRKVDPTAVGRNRIKRVLRDVFRRARHQLATGDYVVVVRPAARNRPSVEWREALHGVLQRAGALPLPPATGTMPTSACIAESALPSERSMQHPHAG